LKAFDFLYLIFTQPPNGGIGSVCCGFVKIEQEDWYN